MLLFLCSDTTNRQYCLIGYRTTEIPAVYYLEGPTKELVSPFKFILPSDKNMRTSQQSKDSLKTVQDIFLRSERSVLQGSPFVRLAGLSGAAAIAFAAFGKYFSENEEKKVKGTLAKMRLSSAIALADADLMEACLLEARMKKLASRLANATNKIEEAEKTKRINENIKELVMKQQMKKIFEKTNMYHFLHTFALLAAPLARKPALTGTLMIGGMTLYCGSGYYLALGGLRPLLMAVPSLQNQLGMGVAENRKETTNGDVANLNKSLVLLAIPYLGAIMLFAAWLTFLL